MTTQVLISNQRLSESLLSDISASKTRSETAVEIPVETAPATSTAVTAAVTARSLTSAGKRGLPYQTNHQVELLHLQAEAEVLLQQLRVLQQQKTTSAS